MLKTIKGIYENGKIKISKTGLPELKLDETAPNARP